MANDIDFSLIEKSLRSLYRWIRANGLEDYDPYDWLNSPLSKKMSPKINFIMSQLNRYSPINFRSIFKIKKGISNKTLALVLLGTIKYYHLTHKEDVLDYYKTLSGLLGKKVIKTPDGIGWASYYFNFSREEHILKPTQPDIIATSEAIKAYSIGYSITKEQRYKQMLDRIWNMIKTNFVREYKDVKYIKYYPDEKEKIVFNVSGLVLNAISHYFRYVVWDDELHALGEELIRFLTDFQQGDGSWPYSCYYIKKTFKKQLDYHQGFIIDGLVSFLPYIDDVKLKEKCMGAIDKAIKFYRHKQFSPEGWSYYRYPQKWPIDIHNQAQGIITFSNFYNFTKDVDSLNFAFKIAKWTIENMQDKQGFFYHQVWPIFINRVPYMRWNQAWMLVALTSLLESAHQQEVIK